MTRLNGKTALISGGARGQGAETARIFAREGAKVVIGDILEKEGRQVEAAICEKGGDCVFLTLDVTQEDHWQNAVKETLERFGKIDALVNNAGIGGAKGADGKPVAFEDTTEEQWDIVQAVNCKGIFFGIKHVIPEMKMAGGGSIINMSSIFGLVGSYFSAHSYHASKGAVRILTKSIAVQYARYGIRCNSVHPGTIETPMTERMLADPANREMAIGNIPLGRIGTAEDVANAILFLASDESSYITGSELVVDGGITAR